MYLKTVCIALVVVSVTANDLSIGFPGSNLRKIYGEVREANPALWKRTEEIIVDAPGTEVISAISITDLRDNKDGEAFIQSGGIGQKSVTIALKSPTILRGYRFNVEVFSSSPTDRYYNKGGFQQLQYDRKF